MSYRKVEKGPVEIGRFWQPQMVGESIEGNIFDFVKDDYNNLRIELYRGENEDGMILTQLPAHADLKRTYVNLNKGDYILVKVVKIIEPTGKSKYPKLIYEVLVDDDRAVEFQTTEEDDL